MHPDIRAGKQLKLPMINDSKSRRADAEAPAFLLLFIFFKKSIDFWRV